jgi:hypothetical protein
VDKKASVCLDSSMTVDEGVVVLRAANAAPQAENVQVRADLAAARDVIAQLQARSAELEQRTTPPPRS